VIEEKFDGVQARFVETTGLTRDTASKWFGPGSFRVPDTRTLASVATRCGVSIDWLVLGRSVMTWPAISRTCGEELIDAVYAEAERRGIERPHRALEIVAHAGSNERLWDLFVEQGYRAIRRWSRRPDRKK
jgi:hypothetical protein